MNKDRREERAEVLERLRVTGEQRRHARRLAAVAQEQARVLIPRARDAGATVQECADAYGISRAAVYVLMRGGAA